MKCNFHNHITWYSNKRQFILAVMTIMLQQTDNSVRQMTLRLCYLVNVVVTCCYRKCTKTVHSLAITPL